MATSSQNAAHTSLTQTSVKTVTTSMTASTESLPNMAVYQNLVASLPSDVSPDMIKFTIDQHPLGSLVSSLLSAVREQAHVIQLLDEKMNQLVTTQTSEIQTVRERSEQLVDDMRQDVERVNINIQASLRSEFNDKIAQLDDAFHQKVNQNGQGSQELIDSLRQRFEDSTAALRAEFEQKYATLEALRKALDTSNAALRQELEQKNAALNALRQDMDQKNATLNQEAEQKNTALRQEFDQKLSKLQDSLLKMEKSTQEKLTHLESGNQAKLASSTQSISERLKALEEELTNLQSADREKSSGLAAILGVSESSLASAQNPSTRQSVAPTLLEKSTVFASLMQKYIKTNVDPKLIDFETQLKELGRIVQASATKDDLSEYGNVVDSLVHQLQASIDSSAKNFNSQIQNLHQQIESLKGQLGSFERNANNNNSKVDSMQAQLDKIDKVMRLLVTHKADREEMMDALQSISLTVHMPLNDDPGAASPIEPRQFNLFPPAHPRRTPSAPPRSTRTGGGGMASNVTPADPQTRLSLYYSSLESSQKSSDPQIVLLPGIVPSPPPSKPSDVRSPQRPALVSPFLPPLSQSGSDLSQNR